MIRYVASRLIQGLITVFIAVLIIFSVVNLAPGDPILFLVGGGEPPPPDVVAQLRREYGLDRPLIERLGIYASKLLRLDLGHSYIYQISVAEMVLARLKATALLAIPAYVLSTLFGVALAVVATRRPGTLLDKLINGSSTVLFSLPTFWVGEVLVLVFAVKLDLLPASGLTDPKTPPGLWNYLTDVARHIVLPLATLTLVYLGLMTRVARSLILEVMQEDFVMMARAVGYDERTLVTRYALRVAILPVITMANYNLAFLLSGSILVETVFSWPGIGTLLYDSILKRDYPMISGIFYATILFSVLINLVTDLVYALLDPRVRLARR
ncbi:MAG: ABC transporter permease [Fervidicoccaceae archaeon]